MALADLRARVGSVELATPVIAASGTYGYGVEYDGLVDWSRVGAVSVKGLSTQPSAGHPAPRMVETAAGMLNAIGLQNIGVDQFVSDKLPDLLTFGVRVIANCWGNEVTGYEEVVSKLDAVDGIDALELNLSSPNKREWGSSPPSSDADATRRIVAAARKCTAKPLWVKLTPNVTDITESALAAEDAGADAVSLINTLKGMAVDLRARRPVLANGTGGLSGPAIKPVALFMVHEVAKVLRIPVVGGGGIASGEDAAEFLMVGASAVQVGTASLYDPDAPARISRELEDVLESLGETSVSALIGTLAGG
jgi:dihydroorotate dehydrogenase (NAD+) catalytic subunit